jgi:hypothetical protein
MIQPCATPKILGERISFCFIILVDATTVVLVKHGK